jgi:hypothetical protein
VGDTGRLGQKWWKIDFVIIIIIIIRYSNSFHNYIFKDITYNANGEETDITSITQDIACPMHLINCLNLIIIKKH